MFGGSGPAGGVPGYSGVFRGIPGCSGPVPGVTDTPHVLLLLFVYCFLKTSGSNVTSKKAVLFLRTEYSKRKFVFQFFKAIFDTSFRPSLSFLVNRTYLYKRHAGRKLTSPEFCVPGFAQTVDRLMW